MDEIEQALQGLAIAPLPERADIEHGVMARINAAVAARAARPSLGAGLTAASTALIIGIATAGFPNRPDHSRLELSVFSANAALAPATLLAVG